MHKLKTLNTTVRPVAQSVRLKIGHTPIEIALGIDEEGRTTARRLYTFLELNKAVYARWCRNNITENDFAEEGVDFIVFNIDVENPKGGRPTTDYLLTATFAKKLAMTSNSEKGEQAREYFIRVEEQLKKVAAAMQNQAQATVTVQQRISLDDIFMLDEMQASTRYNLGRYSLRPIAENIGAVVHVGRKVLYSRKRLDEYFLERAE